MNDRKRSGSGIFLMEMILVSGFFLFCAAVCIQVFVRADSMSRRARELNEAVLAAQSIAEEWKAGELEAAAELEQPEDQKGSETVPEPENQRGSENAARSAENGQTEEKTIVWNGNGMQFEAGLRLQKNGDEAGGILECLEIQIRSMDRSGADRSGTGSSGADGSGTEPLYTLTAKRYIQSGGAGYGEE
ncbi:MAG: hypothetical protein Q4F29_00265 [Lachnospiraceae bacterium]|nr:hypothetical protein [Lachnospiraceae bacterium]